MTCTYIYKFKMILARLIAKTLLEVGDSRFCLNFTEHFEMIKDTPFLMNLDASIPLKVKYSGRHHFLYKHNKYKL